MLLFTSCDKEEPQFSPEEDLTLFDAKTIEVTINEVTYQMPVSIKQDEAYHQIEADQNITLDADQKLSIVKQLPFDNVEKSEIFTDRNPTGRSAQSQIWVNCSGNMTAYYYIWIGSSWYALGSRVGTVHQLSVAGSAPYAFCNGGAYARMACQKVGGSGSPYQAVYYYKDQFGNTCPSQGDANSVPGGFVARFLTDCCNASCSADFLIMGNTCPS